MSLSPAQARDNWDALCLTAAKEMVKVSDTAQAAGDKDLTELFDDLLDQIHFVHGMVDLARMNPLKVAPGFRDMAQALGYPPYEQAGDALSALISCYGDCFGVTDWDWTRGYPRGWLRNAFEHIHRWFPVTMSKTRPQ